MHFHSPVSQPRFYLQYPWDSDVCAGLARCGVCDETFTVGRGSLHESETIWMLVLSHARGTQASRMTR